jgi:hypothetical protein
MSWSVSAIGRPEKVIEYFKEEAAKLSGQSRVEIDAAMPHVLGLLGQNFAREGSGHQEPLVQVETSGSGQARNGEQVQRSVSVSLKVLWAKVLM